jgi:hypothetical protein
MSNFLLSLPAAVVLIAISVAVQFAAEHLFRRKWRLIGSAPKDRPVLVSNQPEWPGAVRVAVCTYSKDHNCWLDAGGSQFHGPTHWLPLPKFP